MSLLFRNVEVDGHVLDVHIDAARIDAVVAAPRHRGDEVIDGGGGALHPRPP